MTQILRQSTQIKVVIGPVVAVGDGFTPVTTLDLSTADEAEIMKSDAAAVTSISAATFAAISSADGYYNLTLTTSLTDTVGLLTVLVNDDSLCLPVKATFQVIEEAIYDAMYAASANAWSGAAGSTTVTALAAGSVTATVIATGAIDADAIADNAIDAGAIAADAFTAAKFHSDVTTEFQNGLATAAALDAVDNFVDTEVAAIITLLGTPAGASLAADIAAIEAQTDDIGTAGAGLTAVPWNAAWDAEVQSEATDALVAYDPPTRAEATADKDELAAYLAGLVVQKGTIGSTGNDTTHVHVAASYSNDEINNYLIVIKDVSEGEWHARYIEDFTSTGDLVTVATLPFTPEASVDLYVILAFRQDVTGGSGLDAAGVRAAVGLASANLDTQLSTIDTVVDAIKAKTDNLTFTVAGLVDSNVLRLVGVAQSASDLKDFADDGYDPATNKVQGVVLVDTITTYTGNTLQTGDSYAIVNSGTHGNAALKTLIDTLDNFVDTEVAAIKAKTDSLTFTVAGFVDANVQYVNDVEVDGVGSTGDPWGPV